MVSSGRQTVTTLAPYIPEQWTPEALGAIEFKTQLWDSVDHHYEAALKVGDIVNVPRVSNLTSQTKSAGSDVTFEQITEGTQQITVDTHDYAALYIEDMAQALGNVQFRTLYMNKFGYALARARDVAVAALPQSYATSHGTLGQELADDDLLDSWTDLKKVGLEDDDENSFLWISPAALAALLKQDKFINQLYGGPGIDMVKMGRTGKRIYGAQIIMSNLLRAAAAGQADCAMQHKSQIAGILALEPTKLEFHNPAGIGWQVIMHNIHGADEINRPPETAGGGTAVDTYGVYLKSKQ